MFCKLIWNETFQNNYVNILIPGIILSNFCILLCETLLVSMYVVTTELRWRGMCVIVMSQGSGNIGKSLSVRTNEPLNSNVVAFTPQSEIDF